VLLAVQVQVEVPDVQGRWDILKVHAKNKKLAEDVNLESVAMRVPGQQRLLFYVLCSASSNHTFHTLHLWLMLYHLNRHGAGTCVCIPQASAAPTWPTC
jgi:hypothetical protein